MSVAHRPSASPATSRRDHVRASVPPNLFGIPFGLAGLAGTWLAMAGTGRAAELIGDGLLVVTALAWSTVLGVYMSRVVVDRAKLRRDLSDPVLSPFMSLALVTPTLLSVDGVLRFAPGVGRIMVDVFIGLIVVLGAWLTGQWIYQPLSIDQIHPGYFLPTVAGGLIAAWAAAEVGQPTLAYAMLGLGGLCWLVLGSVILIRLITRPLPPTPLLPTLAIEVAPAAVASLAWFAINGDRVDTVAMLLGGYGLLMALAQFRLLPVYRRLPFMPSTWSFTFSWAAVATAAIHWLDFFHPGGYRIWTWVVVAAVTALIVGIAIRTCVALSRRELLPRPATG